MASYWQNAKKEAQRRAKHSGYCWVWSNPVVDWNQPYLFYESEVNALPPWVPKDATRFGEGPYKKPKPKQQPKITMDDIYSAFGLEIDQIKMEVEKLKREKKKSVVNPPVTTTKPMLRTARDPHHNGCAEWGYDGMEFWQRQVGTERWVRVKRSHLTAKRVRVLYHLMVGDDEPSC